jgi:integrase
VIYCIRPELAAFFGCLYYAALRPEEAVTLRRDDLILPVLADMLHQHLRQFGTTPDGRLFPGARGGMLSESVYGHAWQAARHAALSPELAATPLARRPYDLRHAALSLWLNATGEPAEVAARAGTSARVLHEVYLHRTDGQGDTVSQRIEDALDAATGTMHSPPHAKESGYEHRRHHPDPVRYMYANRSRSRAQPTATRPARPATPHAATRRH